MSKIRIASFIALTVLAGAAYSGNPRDPDYYWEKAHPSAIADAKSTIAGANGPMHRVYKCHTSDRIWIEKMVPNDTDGNTSNHVEPHYHTMCPLGSGVIAFEAAASTESRPYDDSANPLSPSHKFH